MLAGPIGADTGWSGTAVFAAFSFSLVLGAALARPAGRAIDRAGGRQAMTAGSVLAAAGLLVAAAASSLAVYFLAWAILGVAMRLMLYEAAFATLTHAAGGGARRAISVLTLYGGFASTVFWPIGWWLAELLGWRGTCVAFAALNLALCAPLHAFALPRAGAAAAVPAGSAATDGPAAVAPAERRFALWTLTAAFALFMYVNAAISAHLVDMLRAVGLSAAAAVSLASLRGVGQVAARLVELLFGARLPPLALSVIAIGLTPAAFGALLTGAQPLAAALFTLIQGASNGLVTIARGVTPLLLFGPRGYGALIGTMAAPGLIASALAPAVHAAVVDAAGQGAALALNLAAAALALGLVLLLAWRTR